MLDRRDQRARRPLVAGRAPDCASGGGEKVVIVDLEKAGTPPRLDADLCIAGAGAAGIALALQFAAGRQRVVVLEGGGNELEEESQDLYKGEILGRPYTALDACRLRYFGGTTNHWGGMCRPLDAEDFAPRAWVPHSGWPIGIADLEPYSAVGHDILDLGPPDYDPAAFAPPEGALAGLDPERFRLSLFRFSPPTRFARKFRATLAEAEAIEVYLNANVVDLELSEDGRGVVALHVVGPGGARSLVRARAFVLAMGGIETPRLLLNAVRQQPAGVGNGHDLVGRFFCEHPNKIGGSVISARAEDLLADYRALRTEDGRVRHSIALSPALQEREGTLNLTMTLQRTRDSLTSPGYQALQGLLEQLKGREFGELGPHVRELIGDLGGAAGDSWRALRGTLEDEVLIRVRAEQAPDPASRVVLLDETDALGLRRVGLDWRLGSLEKHTMQMALHHLGMEIGRLELGRLQVHDWLRDSSPTIESTIAGGAHHMGTTRMADDPRQGVVDRDCRVHGLDNLYIAGSSVFPTVGFANPTLTIVELALRLADHLQQRLPAWSL
jgi:choline dehydrogenase-like flavoprotein